MNVVEGGQKILFTFDGFAVKPLLEKVTGATVLFVVPKYESGAETSEKTRQLLWRRVEDQMDMVIHETVGININIILFLDI